MARFKVFLLAVFFTLSGMAAGAQNMKLGLLVYNGGGDWYANPTSLKNLAYTVDGVLIIFYLLFYIPVAISFFQQHDSFARNQHGTIKIPVFGIAIYQAFQLIFYGLGN